MTTTFRGAAAAPGVGQGTVFVYLPQEHEFMRPAMRGAAAGYDPHHEWRRFEEAQRAVEQDLAEMSQVLNTVAVDIFNVHQLILNDQTLTGAVRDAIHLNQSDAAVATYQAIHDMAELFRAMDDEYFASRAADILDIGRRLLVKLGVAMDEVRLEELPEGAVLLAEDLTPSDVAHLASSAVVGVALAGSTPTAHSAILARSLGLPVVCGLGPEILEARPGVAAIVDGGKGVLLLDPDAATQARYGEILRVQEDQRHQAYDHAHEPAVTRSGERIPVYANINSPDDAAHVRHIGADGIGLLRTEYLFQGRPEPPSVAEQARVYRHLLTEMNHRVLTVRALDAGGDKPVEFLLGLPEANPFLGKRGMRLLLANPDLLRDQYLALAQVVHARRGHTPVRFMLPMVSTAEEVAAARAIIDAAHGEVFGTPRRRDEIALGVLVEVPAAALIARHLAEMVDYFSIGTNDLAQYVMAGDRTNPQVAHLADPLQPAVLHLIRLVCRAAQERELPVSVCGEVAGNVQAVPLLLGLGVTELSAPAPSVPLIKQAVRTWHMAECRDLAELTLRCATAERVHMLLDRTLPAGQRDVKP
ncbi:MAG: phosphoenolpyruvate--protein phosphotransferase [Caldilineaceae bacterium]